MDQHIPTLRLKWRIDDTYILCKVYTCKGNPMWGFCRINDVLTLETLVKTSVIPCDISIHVCNVISFDKWIKRNMYLYKYKLFCWSHNGMCPILNQLHGALFNFCMFQCKNCNKKKKKWIIKREFNRYRIYTCI